MSLRPPLTTLCCALFVLGVGCGDSSSPAADSTTTGPATSTTEGSGGSGSEESSGSVPVDWPYDHGYIKVLFALPPDAADPTVLDRTVTVVVSMAYGECLAAFYENNPTVQQAGTLGGAIFGDSTLGGEGWEELLCSPLFGDHAQCSIVWITQRFDVVRTLTITYDITADLATKPVFFGPIPTGVVAECAEGTRATMEVADLMAFRGIDATGADLWNTASYAPSEAASLDDDPVVVVIAPVEPD